MSKWARRTDGPQTEFAEAFRKLGYHVWFTFRIPDCVDIVISKDKFTAAVEIKDGSKPPSQRKLTDGELKFKASFKGRYYLCESINDVHKINRAESAIVKAAGLNIKENVG